MLWIELVIICLVIYSYQLRQLTYQHKIRIIIESNSANQATHQLIRCPASFVLKVSVRDAIGYVRQEYVVMNDISHLYLILKKKFKERFKEKYSTINSKYYINEKHAFYKTHIMSSLVCNNLRIKGMIEIGKSLFELLPQVFQYKTPLKIAKENDNNFSASEYQIDEDNREYIIHHSYHVKAPTLPKRIVEMYIVADNSFVDKYYNEENSVAYIFEIVAYLNMMLQYINVVVYPVNLVFDHELNFLNDIYDIDKALAKVSLYRGRMLKDIKHDTLHFLSAIPFSQYSGRAYLNGMCHYRNSVAIISDYYSKTAMKTAATMAHEMGHSLGIRHDKTNCYCIDEVQECIMSRKTINSISSLWSNCSISSFLNISNTGVDYCLYDMPQSYKLASKKSYTNCRRQTNCTMASHCQCSEGDCCDPNTCAFYRSGHECRPVANECDLPEFCSGHNNVCPNDLFVKNGSNCDEDKGHCLNGICGSASRTCKQIFGKDFSLAREECYEENLRGTAYQGHCGFSLKTDNIKHFYVECEPRNKLCGLLKCDYNFRTKPNKIEWQSTLENINYLIYEDGTYCYFGQFNTNLTGMANPTMVPDGSPCGLGMYCINQSCVNIKP